jgi:protein tyrosine phosphatase type 4A
MNKKIQSNYNNLIECKNRSFLALQVPTNELVDDFIKIMVMHNVKYIVHIIDITYDKSPYEDIGIKFYEFKFADGKVPSKELLDKWINFLKNLDLQDDNSCIVVHCQAGLGRSPLLIAIAIIYYENNGSIDVMINIRKKIKGALNSTQIEYLNKNEKLIKSYRKTKSSCIIM